MPERARAIRLVMVESGLVHAGSVFRYAVEAVLSWLE